MVVNCFFSKFQHCNVKKIDYNITFEHYVLIEKSFLLKFYNFAAQQNDDVKQVMTLPK